jgi:hypothetical protein
MKNYGRTRLSAFLGDRVVYRNLIPLDRRLPSLAELAGKVGLAPDVTPRKSEPDYARVIVEILRRAIRLDAPGASIKKLVFVGDTRLNDSTAFANICAAGDWSGYAFIAAEDEKTAAIDIAQPGMNAVLYFSNRWASLFDFDAYIAQQDFVIDEQTAVIVDLDKTALGARGRNAHVIDLARRSAVRDTVSGLLGDAFNTDRFRTAYDLLNAQEYHRFTRDNQDYLAYICLILGSGMYDLDDLVRRVDSGEMTSFHQFIAEVDRRRDELQGGLGEIHQEIYAFVLAGDPTPFKPFRREEYLATVGRMGHLADDAPVEKLLAEEIVATREVSSIAGAWAESGALLFGLSDKPDEASIPTAEQAAQGYAAIHHTETHLVGA